ncbi:MAG: DUF3868 domain-containing protein [Muribaculaceae bacterium]
MKRFFSIMAALMCISLVAAMPVELKDILINSPKVERNGNYMLVYMHLDLTKLSVGSNRAVVIKPCLVNGNDSLVLPAVGVYGRNRYIYYQRHNGETMLTGKDGENYRSSKTPSSIAYRQMPEYAEWMDGAVLRLYRYEYGCCNKQLSEDALALLTTPKQEVVEVDNFFPELVYVRPEAEARKSRNLEGSAFIDFPVNRTVIYPEYRRNTVELAKIRATIDSVRLDKDVTINTVWLKGYASPESPYSHNRDLAIGRTAALKQYIQDYYKFDASLISTDYEPEDWAGLRRFVEKSTLEHRSGILDIIDSGLEPDKREKVLKTTYPDEYRYLLRECYPALRHTDYRITYTVRGYSDVDEIKAVMAKRPQNLSLNEFYLVAQTYESGSHEFAEVFETAARMFPDDAVANLNAANIAIKNGEFERAERHLSKAGDSKEAVYSRGVLAYIKGDYDTAKRLLSQAESRGMSQATEVLSHIAKKQK